MFKKTAFFTTLAALTLAASVAVAGMSLQAAKSQGLVGERPDGLVGAVKPSAEVEALVAETNSERMKTYNAIAAKNGTAVEKVQAVAGQKLIDNAGPGEYVMSANGWVRK